MIRPPRAFLPCLAAGAVGLRLLGAGAGLAAEPPRPSSLAQAPPPAAEPAPPVPEPASPPAPEPAPEPEPEEREVTRVPLVSVERGGLLLGSGRLTIEPSITYAHETSTRLILTGFSVIPLIILGTLESERVDQDSLTAALNLRYGLLKDTQVSLNVPYSYQTQTRLRLSNERVSLVEEDTSQFGFGDVTFGISYQAVYERRWWPDVNLGLSVRAPTGRSQFDIFEDIVKRGEFSGVEDFVRRLNGEGLPTGSGFWGVTGSVSVVKALDPAVLFATLSYTYNFEETVTLIELIGLPSQGGVILNPRPVRVDLQPGPTVALSVGIALALSREVSFSLAFADAVTLPSKRDGQRISDSRLNVGSLTAGFTLALTRRISLDFSGTAGLTADAPDFGLRVGVPVLFDSIKDLIPFWR